MSDEALSYAKTLFARFAGALGMLTLGVALAIEAAKDGWAPRAVYNKALAELRMAEAMVRRMAALIALKLDLAPTPPADPLHTPRPAHPVRRPGVRRLPLFDAFGGGRADWDRLSQTPPATHRLVYGLIVRLDLVKAVMDDPAPMAQRLARWMRRREQRRQAEITARSRPEHAWLSPPGPLPGCRAKDRDLPASLLRGLQQQVRMAYPP